MNETEKQQLSSALLEAESNCRSAFSHIRSLYPDAIDAEMALRATCKTIRTSCDAAFHSATASYKSYRASQAALDAFINAETVYADRAVLRSICPATTPNDAYLAAEELEIFIINSKKEMLLEVIAITESDYKIALKAYNNTRTILTATEAPLRFLKASRAAYFRVWSIYFGRKLSEAHQVVLIENVKLLPQGDEIVELERSKRLKAVETARINLEKSHTEYAIAKSRMKKISDHANPFRMGYAYTGILCVAEAESKCKLSGEDFIKAKASLAAAETALAEYGAHAINENLPT